MIAVPDKLREITRELVRSFRKQYLCSKTVCSEALDRLSLEVTESAQGIWGSHWNQTVAELFESFSIRLVSKYGI